MSLYPSLEDMKAQAPQMEAMQEFAAAPVPVLPASLYPSLSEYMGIAVPVEQPFTRELTPRPAPVTSIQVIAPISGAHPGLQRAQLTHSIRQVSLVKDNKGKLGLRLRDANKGVFVQFVAADSPAAKGGIRFGDQVLQIDGENVCGYSASKAMSLLKKGNKNGTELILRDRPFCRTVTLHKASNGLAGFGFQNGIIKCIAKDSSAARNGLLTDHAILEVDGQCVVGLKDKQIKELLSKAPNSFTLTVTTKGVHDAMMKCIGNDLVKRMSHRIPDFE